MQKLQITSVRATSMVRYVEDLISRNGDYYRRWLQAEGDIPNAEIRCDGHSGEVDRKKAQKRAG